MNAEIVPDPRLPDLVMLILRMAHQLKEHYPESDLPSKAEGYLQRKNIMPDVESAVIRNALENAKKQVTPENKRADINDPHETTKWLRNLGALRPMATASESILVLGNWINGVYPIQWSFSSHAGEQWAVLGVPTAAPLTREDCVRILVATRKVQP